MNYNSFRPMKALKTTILSLALLTGPLWAIDSAVLEDFSYSISGNTAITGNDLIAAYWGTYTGGEFTIISGGNAGFAGLSGDDMTVTLSQTNNSNIAESSFLAVGFFDIPEGSSFSSVTSTTARAILTDTSWVTPAFSISPGVQTFSFTSNTVAQVGSFTFSAGGNDSITLSAVPEPATYAALFGAASIGFCVWRKRRKA